MKKVKGWLALALTSALLVSCAACGGESAPAPETQPTVPAESDKTILARVETLVADGQYEAAYLDLLKVQGDGAKAWFKKLVFLPVAENVLYNDRGLLLKEESDQFTEEYTYDENGVLTRKVLTWDDGDVTTYTYENGILTKLQGVNSDGTVDEGTYTHDDKGNLLSGVFVTNRGKADEQIETITYYYDEEGNQIGYKQFDFLGREFSSLEIYDEKGQHIRTDVVDRGKKITQYYTYDQQGNLLTIRETQHGEDVLTGRYTYDEAGHRLSYTEQGGNYTRVIQYTYDQAGDCVRYQCDEVYTDGQTPQSHEATMTYDTHGRMLTHLERGEQKETLTTYTYSATGYTETVKTDEDETVKTWNLCYFPEGLPEHMESLQPDDGAFFLDNE